MNHRYLFILFIASIILSACQSGTSEPTEPKVTTKVTSSNSTKAMIDSIKAIIAKTNFRKHPYESGEKAKVIAQEVNSARANGTLDVNLYIEYALTLLNSGESQKAINIFEEIIQQAPAVKEINQQTKNFHEGLALAYLRLGEQRNCIENHSDESCLFPIKGKGIHKDRTGSEAAIKKYEAILKAFPDDLRTRWLLNLAYMTLGDYPGKVPKTYLMPPQLFQSDFEIPTFENIASQVGLDVNDLAGGVILDDFNNDGWNDIVISSWSLFGQVRIFLNDGKGSFVDKTQNSGLVGLTGGLNMIQADYNNDGHLDFYVIRGAWRGLDWMGQLPNSLIKNNGDGTFEDVTITSGMYYSAPTQSAVWLDFNVDGKLDLFVGHETHLAQETHPCQLWLNNGDGTFTDVAPQMNINFAQYVKGVATGDFNNDNLPDIYISVLTGPNILLQNKGGQSINDWAFENIAAQNQVEEPKESFPTWFFDFNNDGWEDIYVSPFDLYSLKQQSREVAADFLNKKSNADFPRLYLNKEGKGFENIAPQLGLNKIIPAMGCNYGDMDNDGWLDFYLGTGAPDFRAVVPNRMFRNDQGKKFQDVTFAGNFGHIQKGHGISFADMDNDGDQDIYAVQGGSYSGDISVNVFFENPGFNHSWLNLELVGQQSNRSAIGAKIKIMVLKSDGSSQIMYRTVSSGGSFGANSLRQEIGLGDIKAIQNVSVNWPNGKNEYVGYGSFKPNNFVRITENKSINEAIEVLDIKAIPFNKTEHQHHHHH